MDRLCPSIWELNFTVLSVGRVMTCVLGMVVRREREIPENFVKLPLSIMKCVRKFSGNCKRRYTCTT